MNLGRQLRRLQRLRNGGRTGQTASTKEHTQIVLLRAGIVAFAVLPSGCASARNSARLDALQCSRDAGYFDPWQYNLLWNRENVRLRE